MGITSRSAAEGGDSPGDLAPQRAPQDAAASLPGSRVGGSALPGSAGGRTAGGGVQPDFAAVQQQEYVFILLNISILAALMLIQVPFHSRVARPSTLIVALFAGRTIWQLLELIWLRWFASRWSPVSANVYKIGTVYLHLAFAVLVILLSDAQHAHYAVLPLLPTIAAAFRFRGLGTFAVVAAASATTVAEVWLHFARYPVEFREAEYLEAATVILIYATVAIVVQLLVRQLQHKETNLQESLDVLARTRDQLVAEEKLAAIGRLSAAVAHEIRNPVAIITSAIAAAQRERFAPPARDQMCRLLEQQSARLTRITEEFLSYARQKPPECSPTSVRVTLDYVAGLLQPRAEELRVQVRVLPGTESRVPFDAFQVHQALFNLGLNAVEAAGEGGVVTLACRPADGGCIFAVSNTGTAISPEALTRVFEPFYTTKPQGTGLGLAIARKIAEAHGGSLRLVGNAPDAIEFELHLPAGPRSGRR